MAIEVLLDPRVLGHDLKIVTIRNGKRGFTQILISENAAGAVAEVLGVPLTLCKPGTTVPQE